MNAYDRWLEQPYQDAYAAEEGYEEAYDLEAAGLADDMKNKPKVRIELFDEAVGYRSEDQADRITKAYLADDAAAMLAVMSELLDAQWEREVDMRIEAAK